MKSSDNWASFNGQIQMTAKQQITSHLSTLSKLERGWFEGRGAAPALGDRAKLLDTMTSVYPDTLPIPTILPTPYASLANRTVDKSFEIYLSVCQAVTSSTNIPTL